VRFEVAEQRGAAAVAAVAAADMAADIMAAGSAVVVA
jgi:hypothetical protein